MAADATLKIVVHLYRSITQQQQVVDDHQETVRFLNEANDFLDVERLTGVIMREASEDLEAARGILDDLYTQLDWALDLWGHTTANDNGEGQPTSQYDDLPLSPEPFVKAAASPVSNHHSSPLDPDDPNISSHMRHKQQWEEWAAAPTIHNPSLELSRPTRWWMQEKTQYGLCQPDEQDRLENSARAAQFNRAHAPVAAPAPARFMSFGQAVRSAQQRQFLSSDRNLPPAPGVHLSHTRRARAGSADIRDDEDVDDEFWQKNLRPGNIWIDRPRYPIPKDDGVSPRTRLTETETDPSDPPSATPVPASNAGGKKLQVGSTCPADYFPGAGAKQINFRSLTMPSRKGQQ
jgi:hypothetical protein